MTSERLICLANIVKTSHSLLFALAIALLLLFPAFPSSSALKTGLIYVCGLIAGTTLGQLLFQGDCPLTVLEFCLRGLGGEKFSYSRFYTMTELAEREMAPRDIYRRLLWRSSVYTLIVGVAVIIAAILITPTF